MGKIANSTSDAGSSETTLQKEIDRKTLQERIVLLLGKMILEA